MDVVMLGIVAGGLQAAGYLVYGSKVLKRDITPNAASWLMFAYGTTLLLVLEWDRNASAALLVLPAVCALASIILAWYCLRKIKRAWWPEHILERISFALDVFLTVAYVAAWVLLSEGIIGEGARDGTVIFILLCWNVGIFTSFYPLLRQVYHHPATEHFLPWVIWTCAYGVLTVITFVERGGADELIFYPALNAAVHGFIAARVGYAHWRRHQQSSLAL